MNEKIHPYEPYRNVLEPALTSKAEEFTVLGYDEVKEHELWAFLTKKKWKKPQEGIRMYELVSDVLSMKIGEYMNFATVEAYRSPNWFADLESEELKALLNPKDNS